MTIKCEPNINFQIDWLNAYHERVEKEVGEEILQKNGKTAAYEWVIERTRPMSISAAQNISAHLSTYLAFFIITVLVVFH